MTLSLVTMKDMFEQKLVMPGDKLTLFSGTVNPLYLVSIISSVFMPKVN